MRSALREVQRQADADVPLERIEAFIESRDHLTDEERAVCWLVAYIHTSLMTVAEFAAQCGRPQAAVVVLLG